MFTRPSKIIHFEFKNVDVESLTTQDVKLIKRNLHNSRSFTIHIHNSTKITSHFFGITKHFRHGI